MHTTPSPAASIRAGRAAQTRQRREANGTYAKQAALKATMLAYNAARREWEANGKRGRQPSLKDFEAQGQ